MASRAHRLDRRGRVLVMVAVAVMAAMVAILAFRVNDTTGPLRVDAVTSRILDSPRVAAELSAHHLGRLDSPRLLDKAVWLGSPVAFGFMCAALCVWALHGRDLAGAALAVLAPPAAMVTTELILKPLVNRPRGSGYLFPSGHVTSAAAVATVAVILSYRRWGTRGAAVAIPAALLPLAVGLGVVRLNWHFLSDAAGGFGVGTSVVLAAAVITFAVEDHARSPGRDLSHRNAELRLAGRSHPPSRPHQ